MIDNASGASVLPLVEIDTHSEELRDERGFIGDRANRRAFDAVLQDWRDRVRLIVEEDPLGGKPGRQSKKKLDRAHRKGNALTAGLMHTAIEEFAAELATVTLRFLETEQWQGTERIVVGGGLSSSRVGEVIIGRASVLVKAEGKPVLMSPIRSHPDEAALIGATQLVPSWMLRGSDALLAVDIGGSNIRAGLVELRLDVEPDLSLSRVRKLELWRYADEKVRPTREEAIRRIVSMLTGLVAVANEDGLKLAPIVGVACPGEIDTDGSILRGGQNLPGDWEDPSFNLGVELTKGVASIDGHEPLVIIHNDAVVQGLSEAPFMRDVDRWGVLTIGTGLGNARFSNRPSSGDVAAQADA